MLQFGERETTSHFFLTNSAMKAIPAVCISANHGTIDDTKSPLTAHLVYCELILRFVGKKPLSLFSPYKFTGLPILSPRLFPWEGAVICWWAEAVREATGPRMTSFLQAHPWARLCFRILICKTGITVYPLRLLYELMLFKRSTNRLSTLSLVRPTWRKCARQE